LLDGIGLVTVDFLGLFAEIEDIIVKFIGFEISTPLFSVTPLFDLTQPPSNPTVDHS
jgi:hypothetical protein